MLQPDPPELGKLLTKVGKFMAMGAAWMFVAHIGHFPRWLTFAGSLPILFWWMRDTSQLPSRRNDDRR